MVFSTQVNKFGFTNINIFQRNIKQSSFPSFYIQNIKFYEKWWKVMNIWLGGGGVGLSMNFSVGGIGAKINTLGNSSPIPLPLIKMNGPKI